MFEHLKTQHKAPATTAPASEPPTGLERVLNIEDRNAYLRELLLLYDGKRWASEQLARIRLKLKSES